MTEQVYRCDLCGSVIDRALAVKRREVEIKWYTPVVSEFKSNDDYEELDLCETCEKIIIEKLRELVNKRVDNQ